MIKIINAKPSRFFVPWSLTLFLRSVSGINVVEDHPQQLLATPTSCKIPFPEFLLTAVVDWIGRYLCFIKFIWDSFKFEKK
nr:uncharacterized protein LOC109783958 isoform X2 [Aegilops tauschii subsp. strangulata]